MQRSEYTSRVATFLEDSKVGTAATTLLLRKYLLLIGMEGLTGYKGGLSA